MNTIKYVLCCCLLILCILSQQMYAQSCSCTEYLYLNDVGTGEVHKFEVLADGTIAEIGSPWMSGFVNPHGLGSDINGFLYIGDSDDGPIYRVTCDGGTVANDALLWSSDITTNLTNIGSYGGYIITNGGASAIDGNSLSFFDPCTGGYVGSICLNNSDNDWNDWGMQILTDGTILVTEGYNWGSGDHTIWQFQFDESLIGSTTCIDPFIDGGYLNNYHDILGITKGNGFLYVITRDASNNSNLLKIDATTGLLVQDKFEGGQDGSGWNGALGLVYAPSSGYLYISGYEDCLSIVNPDDLSYIGPGNGTIPSGSIPKAVALLNECCPTPSDTIIDRLLCNLTYPSKVFLQDLLQCNGIVCEGGWTADPTNTGMTFDSCDNTVTVTGDQACGTFSLFSDGSSALNRCGQFNVTVNVETATIASATISGDQMLCAGLVPTTLISATPTANVSYQWQSSTTDCNTGFSDIAGATTDVYSPAAVTETTYYRIVTAVSGTCATGNCQEFSNCIAVSLDPDCCNVDKCLDINATKIGG